ncbi:hypothetical protein [Ekhidna sp.]|uniref:hypothetical protein n=1 Tax=Ekhidna sp. TaxID=2608089 RepID=UPI003B514774
MCFRLRCIIYLLLSWLSFSAFSQIKFDVNVSDKHLKKVDQVKEPRKKLEKYKKVYSKDSLKAAKRAWKEYKVQHKDSLKSIGRWKEAKLHQQEILLGEYKIKKPKKYVMDYTGFKPPKDSMDWALQELSKRGDFRQVRKVYEAYGQYDSTYLEQFNLDSIKLDSATLLERFNMNERLESYLPPELAQQSDLKIEQQMMNGTLNQYGQLQQIDRSGVKEFFENISPEEFAKSQISIKEAKEKYLELPNLSKEEEGIKRNSLKGTPLKKRFFLNGNVTIQSTDPFVLDANFQLGYQWTQKFSTGVGLLFREQFSDRDSTAITGDAHGFSAFANYDIFQGFFIYGEYQLVKNKALFAETSQPLSWQYSTLLGAGRKFNITEKISLSIALLYDFNYKNNTLNQRPLTPRIGYTIGF